MAWSDAIGLADVEQRVESTVETRHAIASITKTFTASAVMQLRDEGLLDLEDPLSRHLPEAAHGAPTIRRMLSHASGLQREPPGEVWETLDFPGETELLGAAGERPSRCCRRRPPGTTRTSRTRCSDTSSRGSRGCRSTTTSGSASTSRSGSSTRRGGRPTPPRCRTSSSPTRTRFTASPCSRSAARAASPASTARSETSRAGALSSATRTSRSSSRRASPRCTTCRSWPSPTGRSAGASGSSSGGAASASSAATPAAFRASSRCSSIRAARRSGRSCWPTRTAGPS